MSQTPSLDRVDLQRPLLAAMPRHSRDTCPPDAGVCPEPWMSPNTSSPCRHLAIASHRAPACLLGLQSPLLLKGSSRSRLRHS